MKVHPWITTGIVAGLAVTAAWFLALESPSTLSGKDRVKPARKKTDAQKAPNKDSEKPSDTEDTSKPAPYPEDPLNSPAEKNYVGSGAYRWLNVALQATAPPWS